MVNKEIEEGSSSFAAGGGTSNGSLPAVPCTGTEGDGRSSSSSLALSGTEFAFRQHADVTVANSLHSLLAAGSAVAAASAASASSSQAIRLARLDAAHSAQFEK